MSDLQPHSYELDHKSTLDWGWNVVGVTRGDDDIKIKHLIPSYDLRVHTYENCWCHPVEDEEAADFFIHSSADGREAYESGDKDLN